MKNFYILLLTLSIASLSFGQELMLNGDFESWDDPSTPTSYSKAESTLQETVEFHGGANSAKHTGGTKDIAQTVTGIIPGEIYTISLWYKFQEAGNARMWSTWKAGTTTLTDNADVLQPSTYLDSSGTTWVEYSVTLTAPATADNFYFEVRTYGTAVVYWDDFSVFKEATVTPPLLITTSVCATATSVRLTGPWWDWNPVGGPEAVSNNDGTWTFTFDPAPTGNMEYLLVVDGVQENLISIMANGGTCAPLTDSANYANRQWILDSGNVTNNYGQCGTTCVAPVITLTGGDETITVGDAYTDAGATASDDEQGDISANISGITDLDTSVAGVYTVAYNVSDGALNAATEVVRTVTVEAAGACDGATALTIGTQQCGNTNEFGDLFDDSACLGNYDGGDDYIFSYTATTTGDKLDLTITGQLGYTGFAMSQGCPEGGAGTCVGVQTSSGSGALNFESDALIAGEVYYIQISTWPTPQSTDFCLDAVLVPAPSCLAPANFEAAAVTSTSANLTWTASASNETAWNIEYGADGFTQGDGSGTTVAVTANPYAFTALTANTSYDVYLQANCGAGDTSVWVGPLSFTTLCATEIPDYTQGFDPYTGICWTEATGPIAGPTAGTTSSIWFQDEFANTDALGQSAGINIYGTGDESWLISPTFDLSSGGYEINLDAALTAYAATTTGELNGDDAVHVMQSLDEGSTWSSIYTWDATNMPSNVGDNVTIDVSAVTSATVKFALFAFEDTSANGDFDFFIDNFAVRTPPSCFAPAANSIAASLITTTSANLSWTAGATETAWNIEYGATGFALGAGTTVAVTANSYSLMGLTANTSYDFYVQADCGANGTSVMVGPFTFTTLCNAVTTFPWTEDFEGITTPSLPSCWSENDNNADTDFWKTYDEYGTSDSYSAGLYTDYNIDGSWSGPATNNDDYLILPQFALTGNERLKFSVRSRSSGELNDYKVVLSTSSNDPTDFTTDLMALTVATATHTEQVIDLSAYSGNVYIAIHVPADGLDGYYLYVDDFTVEAIPSCVAVTDLAASNLTTTSADLSWTAGATETAWNLEYGATGFVQGAGTTVAVTANSYALTGLAANTSYDVYVQADCGAGDTSTWVGPITIFTGYCVPSSSSSSTFIDSVTSTGAFSDLNNGADGYSETGYANYFSTYAIQSLAGASFDLTATIVGGTAGFAVWIDYNNDLTFDSTEVVFNTTSYANGPFTATIALPETLADGDYRMRLMVDYNDSNPNDDACAFNGTRAEAEDYKITIDSSLGMDTVSKSNFTYFPNPVNNVLSIKAQASIDSITVYNMLGQTVVRSTPNTTTTTVDMSGLQTGAYFVQVAINNSIETVRVIKN